MCKASRIYENKNSYFCIAYLSSIFYYIIHFLWDKQSALFQYIFLFSLFDLIVEFVSDPNWVFFWAPL